MTEEMQLDAPPTAPLSHAHGVERLLVAVQELSLARSLEDVTRIVRTAARDLTGCDGATFVLREDGKCYYADEDAISPLWRGSRFPMESCISGWSMLHKRPAVIPDIYEDPRIPHDAYRPTFVKSLAMVPIRSMDPIGAIGNYWADLHHASDDEVRLLQALADATSVAMENVAVWAELEEVSGRAGRLEAAALTDELTGLLNRRGTLLHGEPSVAAARASGHRITVAFLDVDGLKQVNDARGHDAGDDVLRAVGASLRELAHDGDVIGRLGGDEFLLVRADSKDDPESLRELIRAALADHGVSASLGVVEVPPQSQRSLVQLIARADIRMYADKQGRRS
ncbi:MAG TPA: sensor domain-containing diguanylate cyclase [Nocardioides sp.]|nr:sensor domain-containing diguanylate cyclase [Nocardioides sp.]